MLARKLQEQMIYDSVKAASDEGTASEIVYGPDRQARTEEDATWVKSTMERLENCFDKAAVKRIRMACQCGYEMDEKISLVQQLFEQSSTLEEFAHQEEAKAAGLFAENGVLYLQFPFCPCPMLADVERLDSAAWCQCTTGYSKVLFEKVFGCEVDVELLESVKMGDERCLMTIVPRQNIWQ